MSGSTSAFIPTLSAGTIQLNHGEALRNTNGQPPEATRFIMSLKGAEADDLKCSARFRWPGLSTLNSQLSSYSSQLWTLNCIAPA